VQDFNIRLKELRNSKGVTQKKVATDIEVSERNYQHYEAGTQKPSFDGIIKLASYFQVSTDYLLGLTDIKTPLIPADNPLPPLSPEDTPEPTPIDDPRKEEPPHE